MSRQSVAFVVPGGLDAVTGGNLYDTYVIEALKGNGWTVDVVEPTDRVDSQVVVVDSLAFRFGQPKTTAPMLAVAHQLPSRANQRPEWEDAEQRTLRTASLVIVVADHLGETVKELTDAPIEVIPPGRDHAWVVDGATLEGTVALCVANGYPAKGVPEAIEAFNHAGVGESELALVGDIQKNPAEHERIREALASSTAIVRTLGVVSRDELARLYAEARLLLTASRYEGWPIAVGEAMASGLPIVGFDAQGVRDLVRSSADGILVPNGDIEGLANAVSALLVDRDLAVELGTSARRRALAWPTWKETGGRFVRAVERAAS